MKKTLVRTAIDYDAIAKIIGLIRPRLTTTKA
jgi:hypothetical protein